MFGFVMSWMNYYLVFKDTLFGGTILPLHHPYAFEVWMIFNANGDIPPLLLMSSLYVIAGIIASIVNILIGNMLYMSMTAKEGYQDYDFEKEEAAKYFRIFLCVPLCFLIALPIYGALVTIGAVFLRVPNAYIALSATVSFTGSLLLYFI